MTRFSICLVILVSSGICGTSKVNQLHKDLSRRQDSGFSLISEVTFTSRDNGDCKIFGQDLTEETCRWILGDQDYDRMRTHFWSGADTNPSVNRQIEVRDDGDCIIEQRVLSLDECREFLGNRRYDQLYLDTFDLPTVSVDDGGYCMIGDMEVDPDTCQVFIGRANYVVLVSLKSYSQ